MKALYHLTVLPPKMPTCEALSQEIDTLRARFDGDVVYLNPNQLFPLHLPRFVFGFHKWRQLRARERTFGLHHIYNPDPFPFPILRQLRRPIVYSLTGGVGERRPNIPFFAALAAVTVYDERSLERLRAWGLDNVHLVRSGIDTRRFTCTPLPLGPEIRLLVGSAPWTRAQFCTKGVDTLLEAARREPRLQLVFLWRGVLFDEMLRRVRRVGLERQVTVWNAQVDVNQVLATVHASITLAAQSAIVKAYPHSLLDSLAAGKPVLVSREIPMADYVERTGCGVVVESVSAGDVLAAIEALRGAYQALQINARQVGPRDFTQEAMVASFRRVYEQVR